MNRFGGVGTGWGWVVRPHHHSALLGASPRPLGGSLQLGCGGGGRTRLPTGRPTPSRAGAASGGGWRWRGPWWWLARRKFERARGTPTAGLH